MLYFVGGRGGLQLRKGFKPQIKRLNIKVMEETFITSLLVSDGHVSGAFGVSMRDGKFILFRSKLTVLATGGCCQIYSETDSTPEVTGDGMIMAYKAGAELMDMEFQQFFPFSCRWPVALKRNTFPGEFRYTLRGRFYNALGEPFMERYLPMAKEWGLRDPTSRAIFIENMEGRGSPHGGVYLDVSFLPENLIDTWLNTTKPPWINRVKRFGLDIRKQAAEIGPGCHYSMGGVRVNENCETTLSRLYACGEVASGMDGAERIDGGPALAWCVAMGYITGQETARKAKELDWLNIDPDQVERERARVNALWERKKGVRDSEIKNKIKEMMYQHCSLVRNKIGMEGALKAIEKIKSEDLPRVCVPGPSRIFNRGWTDALEVFSLTDCAEMVLRSALMREETRRSHYRTDFPKRDDANWIKNIVIRREDSKMVFTTVPVALPKIKPTKEEVEE